MLFIKIGSAVIAIDHIALIRKEQDGGWIGFKTQVQIGSETGLRNGVRLSEEQFQTVLRWLQLEEDEVS